jgi:hypothetical protein
MSQPSSRAELRRAQLSAQRQYHALRGEQAALELLRGEALSAGFHPDPTLLDALAQVQADLLAVAWRRLQLARELTQRRLRRYGMSIAPIVGAYFRAPAKAILQALPADTPLRIQPEPENERDPDAVAVWVATSAIPADCHEDLNVWGTGQGFPLEAILEQPFWHLGYIPATSNQKEGPIGAAFRAGLTPALLQRAHDGRPDFYPGVLCFGPDGRPSVRLAPPPRLAQEA